MFSAVSPNRAPDSAANEPSSNAQVKSHDTGSSSAPPNRPGKLALERLNVPVAPNGSDNDTGSEFGVESGDDFFNAQRDTPVDNATVYEKLDGALNAFVDGEAEHWNLNKPFVTMCRAAEVSALNYALEGGEAFESGKTGAVSTLLYSDASPKTIISAGLSLLHVATHSPISIEVIEVLLSAGIDVVTWDLPGRPNRAAHRVTRWRQRSVPFHSRQSRRHPSF